MQSLPQLNFRESVDKEFRENVMKKLLVLMGILLAASVALSQRPSDPALLVMQEGPALNLTPVAAPLSFPTGTVMGTSR